MDEYCRICLQNLVEVNKVHISNQISLAKSVVQAIADIGAVEVLLDDPLPKYLCSNCYQQLLTLHDFRELIISSDKHLKQNLDVLTNKTVKTEKSTLPILICNESNYFCLENALKELKPEEGSPQIIHLQGNNESEENDRSKEIPQQISLQIEFIYEKDRTDSEIQGADIIVHRTQEMKTSIEKQKKPRKRKRHEFKCDICQKVLYGCSNRLEQHIIMAHSDIKKFECETCGKKFKNRQQLNNHNRVHTGEKPYECDVCKLKFTSLQNLFNHKKKHTDKYKIYKCNSCDKSYPTPGELQNHQRVVHTGEKPFLCEICSNSFGSARNLGLHIRSVHEKNEKCPKCGLMLSSVTYKQHMQKHQDKEDGIKRYTCETCGKSFFSPDMLKRHRLVHTGEKPHSCKICNKSFAQKYAVETHMKTHSDVRSFSCSLCAKTFKYKQHLQKHVTKIHGDYGERVLNQSCTNKTSTKTE
ncbi:zinc finger protein OZF-like [Anthonomus grandis grandis]|uniref:zinc finger protein OZF-like n=1 Tax=Anthonomus grandis grandis TaxID=2921223 RepID=UPI00216570B5|nr:zinc finger protein OZF-like [Anthonomus grandis grandis]